VKVHHELFRDNARPLVLAVGFFDGMHRGHREIALATLRMRRPGWRSGVVTFANHPTSFLRPGSEPPLLTTDAERLDLFARTGFEECFWIRFDASVATMTPVQFLDRLTGALGARGICVGSTFRFGHKRAGDVTFMRAHLAHANVQVEAVDNVTDAGERISSTRIRALVAEGNLELADRLLGHAYELRGRVEIGAGRGHDLGFPTANLALPEKLLPKDGVYSAVARYDGRDYAALVSIGNNPQFGGERRSVEVWMRDFHYTVYGHEVALRDLRYVREQRVYASIDELMNQMKTDLSAVAYPSYG
jgi:riboflavin kinase/FMN adenylyltransferase